MEYLDIYDENKNLTGEKILRGEKLEKGKYINIVIMFIENNEGKFLIQKTSKEKGGVFATTGGHVKSGTTSDEAIIEEISEELGLDLSISDLIHIYTRRLEHVLQDVYYLKKDIDINELTLQESEVEYVKWLSVDEINKLIEKEKFRKSNIEAFNHIISRR